MPKKLKMKLVPFIKMCSGAVNLMPPNTVDSHVVQGGTGSERTGPTPQFQMNDLNYTCSL